MRYFVAAVMCLLVPLIAAAQQTSAQTAMPMPSIGLPLPTIGLPLPPIGLDTSLDLPATPVTPVPGQPDGRRHRPAIVIFGAPYAFGVHPALQLPAPGMIAPDPYQEPPPEPTTGTLRLDVEPSDVAQVFVDGEFVGTPDDLGGELELLPGRRQIEIRAPGYEALVFDVRITAGRTITYEGRLQRLTPAAPGKPNEPQPNVPSPVPSATAPQAKTGDTFYLIPGCYLGNVPPDQVKLPAGCDLSKLITHKP